MAFPQVVNSANSSGTGTTLALTMPGSIVAGRLLLCLYGSSGGGEDPGLTGWTKLFNLQVGNTSMSAWVKVAAGSDTGTVSGFGSLSRCATVYQVSDWSGDLSQVMSAGVTATLDPPNLDVPAADWLWIAVARNSADITAAPTNYTNLVEATVTGTWLGSARRELNASSENPGAFSGTSSNPDAATIAIPPVEMFGDITFNTPGAVVAAQNDPAVAYPAGIAAGDLLVLVVGQKPITAGTGLVITPTDWELSGELFDAGGYGATLGADTGNTHLWVYTKTAAGTESGTLTVDQQSSNVIWGQMLRLSSAVGDDWDVAVVTGEDTTAGSWSSTFGSDPGIEAEDYVIGALCIPTDVTTPSQFSAQAFSATGVTFGGVWEISEPDSSLGNDIGGMLCRARVLSGTSSAAPVMTATAGGTTTNVRGPAALVRIRRVTSGCPPASSGNFFPFFL